MKAAILHEFKKPLAMEEVDPPKPGAEEVLIEVEACGVCHSDVRVADACGLPEHFPLSDCPPTIFVFRQS